MEPLGESLVNSFLNISDLIKFAAKRDLESILKRYKHDAEIDIEWMEREILEISKKAHRNINKSFFS
jgi:hypothetical protein